VGLDQGSPTQTHSGAPISTPVSTPINDTICDTISGFGQPREPGRLIFMTNRGPIEHHFGPDGTPLAERGAGGVVSGLLCAASGRAVSWISLAMTDADRAIAAQLEGGTLDSPAGLDTLTSRLVPVPELAYRRHYDGISNRVLWFAQHGLRHAHPASLAVMRRDWETGYVPVNRALADAVVAELSARGATTPVLIHDYHLYLAPAMVRAAVPQARLLHFVHIPWPAPDAWVGMPLDLLRAVYEGLAANDVIGFQTPRDARNFLLGVRRFLPGAVITHDPDEIYWNGRRTLVRDYPIALTPETVIESANEPDAVERARELLAGLGLERGRKLLMRVDRVEPTKNIVRGFRAYERLLSDHPELRERVVFLALLVPSREGMPEYRQYAERVREAIERVNARFGTRGWQPIVAVFGNDHKRALACLREYDALLVNPLADGMNLVVKEGGLVNRRDGAIILSTRAGAHAQLQGGVLSVAPEDVRATAEALYAALTLAPGARVALAARVRSVLAQEDAAKWLRRQVSDLMRISSANRAAAAITGPGAAVEPEALPELERRVPGRGLDAFAARPGIHLAPPPIRRPTPTVPLPALPFSGGDADELDAF
jgi:trehalose 6-phosphate synthase